MKKYKLVGLTGTTGAGKSTVCGVLESEGFCVINADSLAREIMTDEVVLAGIVRFFGDDVIRGGELDRAALAERAFSSPEKTALLNRLTHPYITERLLRRLERLTAAGQRLIVLDAPQLFESRLNLICDVIVAVVADSGERASRIKARDGLTDAQADARISAQLSDDFFRANSDLVIENQSSPEALIEKARAAASRLRAS